MSPADGGRKAGSAYIDILPRTARGFDKELSTQVEEPARRTAGNVNKILGALGAAFVAKGAFDLLKSTTEAAREENKANAQTAAVLKSTGDASKTTAAQIGDLSMAIAEKTGIDHAAVQSGENLLLTFVGIRNEAGKGNDIFNQATQSITDMSVALGQDMKSSAIQLGKALNDPIKGVTALARVGVQFTAQQKDQIKTLVESGKTLEAQKLILAEIKKEFGGSAEAVATPMARLKETLHSLKEQVGNVLVPVIDKFATFLADRLPAALHIAGEAFGWIKGLVDIFREALSFAAVDGDTKVTPRLKGIERVVAVLGATLGGVAKGVKDFVHGFTQGIDGLKDPQTRMAQAGAVVYTVWNDKVRPVLVKVVDFVRDHLKPTLLGLAIVLGLIFAPVTTVVAGLAFLYIHFEKVRDVVDKVVHGLRLAFDFIKEQAIKGLDKLREAVEKNKPQLEQLLHAFRDIGQFIATKVLPILVALGGFLVRFELEYIAGVITAIGKLVTAFDDVASFGKKAFDDLWSAIKDGANAAMRVIVDAINLVLKGYNLLPGHKDVKLLQAPQIGADGAGASSSSAPARTGRVYAAAAGFEGVVDRPTTFLAGETFKPEHVSIVPASALGGGKPGVSEGQLVQHFHGQTDPEAAGMAASRELRKLAYLRR